MTFTTLTSSLSARLPSHTPSATRMLPQQTRWMMTTTARILTPPTTSANFSTPPTALTRSGQLVLATSARRPLQPTSVLHHPCRTLLRRRTASRFLIHPTTNHPTTVRCHPGHTARTHQSQSILSHLLPAPRVPSKTGTKRHLSRGRR